MIMDIIAFGSEPAIEEQGYECYAYDQTRHMVHVLLCHINRDIIAHCDLIETNGKAGIGDMHMGFE